MLVGIWYQIKFEVAHMTCVEKLPDSRRAIPADKNRPLLSCHSEDIGLGVTGL